ncbi:MAG: class I SAM-dependent methyltransferase [Spirochaetes bacterium]|nr:class I SAM-dependent methyltransferase [Spirochaetota bacterium]
MQHAEEFVEYQKYLISDQREKLILPQHYTAQLSREVREDLNVLDFGCGHGYVAMLLALLPLKGLRVYACDTDEECLDVLWGRIAERGVKNLTAFHLPNYSQIYLPGWLPPVDYVFCSFSISTLEHPDIGLPQLVKHVAKGTQFSFTEWESERSHPAIDIYVPPARRIVFADFKQLVEESGLKILFEESGKQQYYSVRAVKD